MNFSIRLIISVSTSACISQALTTWPKRSFKAVSGHSDGNSFSPHAADDSTLTPSGNFDQRVSGLLFDRRSDFTPHVIKVNIHDPRFQQAVQAPLLDEKTLAFPVGESLPKSTNSNKLTLAMAQYHKTGSEFVAKFSQVMQDRLSLEPVKFKNRTEFPIKANGKAVGKCVNSFWDAPVTGFDYTFPTITNPSSLWHVPQGMRLVHWYRDPLQLLLSGYRYHQSSKSAESWEGVQSQGHLIDVPALRALFATCEYNCNYFDLLGSIPEETGILAEALMERQLLQNMQANLKRWKDNENVLHVSLEHLVADFDATMLCICRFSGLDLSLLPHLRKLDASHDPHNRHVTHGKYDNSALEALLLNHQSWGKHFQQARDTYSKFIARQHKLYGCPMI